MNVTITWGDIIVHLGIEIVVGLLVSFLFLRYILYYLRPRIQISPQIAYNDEDGVRTYWFKIVNHSRYEGFDLEFNVEVITMEAAGQNGFNLKIVQHVELNKKEFSSIAGFQSNKQIKKRKTTAPHCFQVRTIENLHQILNDHGNFIRLHVSLKHGLSGISKSFEQQYAYNSPIHKGVFAFGNQYDVVKT